jgi:hypothetical protein
MEIIEDGDISVRSKQRVTVQNKEHGERVFRFVANRPWLTKAGYKCLVRVWESECVECGAPFRVMASSSTNNAFNIVHCEKHRLPRHAKL